MHSFTATIDVAMETLNERIGDWLQQQRLDKGLSQEGLGIQLGRSQSYIAKVEGGKKIISVGELLEFSRALNVSPEILRTALERWFSTDCSQRKHDAR